MTKVYIQRPDLTFLEITISCVWVVMIIGVFFMEATLVFQVPGIGLPSGMDIGKQMFSVQYKIEFLLPAILIITTYAVSIYSHLWYFFSFTLSILILQTFRVFPVLGVWAETIIKGSTPETSSLHILYVVLELIKLFLLITIGLRTYSESLKCKEESNG